MSKFNYSRRNRPIKRIFSEDASKTGAKSNCQRRRARVQVEVETAANTTKLNSRPPPPQHDADDAFDPVRRRHAPRRPTRVRDGQRMSHRKASSLHWWLSSGPLDESTADGHRRQSGRHQYQRYPAGMFLVVNVVSVTHWWGSGQCSTRSRWWVSAPAQPHWNWWRNPSELVRLMALCVTDLCAQRAPYSAAPLTPSCAFEKNLKCYSTQIVGTIPVAKLAVAKLETCSKFTILKGRGMPNPLGCYIIVIVK